MIKLAVDLKFKNSTKMYLFTARGVTVVGEGGLIDPSKAFALI